MSDFWVQFAIEVLYLHFDIKYIYIEIFADLGSQPQYKPKPKVQPAHPRSTTVTSQLDVASLSKETMVNQLPKVYIQTGSTSNGYVHMHAFMLIDCILTRTPWKI